MLVYFFPHSILEFKKQKLSILDVLSESAVKFKDMSKGLWGGRSKCQHEKYFLFMRRKNILLKAFVTNYHIHIRRSRQMAFPILMSAGKVQYFCHLPLLWVHYNKKEALNSVFICLSIWKMHLIWTIRPCLKQYWVIHTHEVLHYVVNYRHLKMSFWISLL